VTSGKPTTEEKTIHKLNADHIHLQIERADRSILKLNLKENTDYLETIEHIDAPWNFIARLSIGHQDHAHHYDLEFSDGQEPAHVLSEVDALAKIDPNEDPHTFAEANDLRHKYANSQISNLQIIMFGLTGGLMPCPAAITVLLVCLQLKKFALGSGLVLCFSIGLACTLVLSGVVAAVGLRQASKRWSGLNNLSKKAPYFSSALICLIGLWVAYEGFHTLLQR